MTTTTITDPRPALATAAEIAAGVIGAVRPDQMSLPTCCEGFDVRGMLAHLVQVAHRIGVVARDGDPFAIPSFEADDDGWVALWNREIGESLQAWADDALLTRPTKLPWAPESGLAALQGYVSELTVHTWDIATATGQSPAWNDEVCELGLSRMKLALPVGDRVAAFEAILAQMPPDRRGTLPFANAVDAPADAPAIVRLVAHSGRQPLTS